MTDSSYTHVAVVLDRSGSMATCRDDMQNGLNEFFATQAKEDGKCLVDFFQFDTEYDVVYTDKLVKDARAVLQPRGMTALNDAVGKTITSMGEKFARMDESNRPGTVIVLVVTDGFENASKEWTQEKVKDAVEHQQNNYNWVFNFLGANMDAQAVGMGYGVLAGQSLTYDTKHAGAMTQSLSANVTRLRGGDRSGYTEVERQENS